MQADVGILVSGGHRTDHHYKITRAIESFTSVAHARATKNEDKRSIDKEILEQFGSFAAADGNVKEMLADYLAEFEAEMEVIQAYERRRE